jgi:hypothetical protein
VPGAVSPGDDLQMVANTAREANPLVSACSPPWGCSVVAAKLALVLIGALCIAEQGGRGRWAMVGGLPLALAIAAGLIGGIAGAAAFLGWQGRLFACRLSVPLRACPRAHSPAREHNLKNVDVAFPAIASSHHLPVRLGQAQPLLRPDLRRGQRRYVRA